MKWALAAASLVVVANVAVLVQARRERSPVAAFTSIDVCAEHLSGGGDTDEAPALRLILAPDSMTDPSGLDEAGLRALGFADAAIGAVGRERDSTFHWPRPRPAWVRLRQRPDSLAQWAVTEVVPLSGRLERDSISIVVRGLVGFRERRQEPPPDATAGHQHGAAAPAGTRGALYPAVLEVIPSRLHLDRGQIAALRSVVGHTMECGMKGQAVIASGAGGGIWVESVR